ncbi:MAG: hypothetical protein FWG91_12795 [Lachnospiraceae bacterium]|nr:hypothetical protein [Lachnospiraceae bacterium]
MKTTKIFALAIALIMVFALAACSDSGNNNSGGSTNTPPPSETPSAPDTSTPSPNQTQGSGDNDPGTGDPTNGNGGDVIIPDNGTPPYVEPPLESHAGDKGYFYVTTDDYAVWINRLIADDGWVYMVASFGGDGSVVNYHWKLVTDTVEAAESRTQGHDGYIRIDNVLYPNPDRTVDFNEASYLYPPNWSDKDAFLNITEGDDEIKRRWGVDEFYFSQP